MTARLAAGGWCVSERAVPEGAGGRGDREGQRGERQCPGLHVGGRVVGGNNE